MPFSVSNGDSCFGNESPLSRILERRFLLHSRPPHRAVDRSSEMEPRTSWRSSWVSTEYSFAAFSWDVVVTVCFPEHLQPCWIELQSSPAFHLHRVCTLSMHWTWLSDQMIHYASWLAFSEMTQVITVNRNLGEQKRWKKRDNGHFGPPVTSYSAGLGMSRTHSS